jgi:hypothetical protein
MRSLLKVVFQSPIIGAELHCHPGLLFKPNGAAASTASTSSETRALALYSLRKSSPEPRRIRLGRLVCADPGAHEQRRQRRRHGWAHSRRHRRRAVPRANEVAQFSYGRVREPIGRGPGRQAGRHRPERAGRPESALREIAVIRRRLRERVRSTRSGRSPQPHQRRVST